MTRALITGITGMVGSHLADYLLENTDWDIYGVCRWRSPLDNVEHLLDRVNRKDRVFFDYADLNDEMSLITVIKKVKPDYEAKRKVKSKVALVFQYPDYQFFSSTVFDDIAFGPRNMGVDEEEMMRRIKKAMHKVGVDFDEISQRSPFELSGGQKRRLAIAEALVMKPKIMVLDEPMAGLDPRGRAALAKLLRTLREDGVTLILVSHNMEDIAELSDEILVMKDGSIFMQGTPREIFIHPTELREINLGIPIETRFANWLSEAGMPMPECVIGLDELVDAIAVAFKERAYE